MVGWTGHLGVSQPIVEATVATCHTANSWQVFVKFEARNRSVVAREMLFRRYAFETSSRDYYVLKQRRAFIYTRYDL